MDWRGTKKLGQRYINELAMNALWHSQQFQIHSGRDTLGKVESHCLSKDHFHCSLSKELFLWGSHSGRYENRDFSSPSSSPLGFLFSFFFKETSLFGTLQSEWCPWQQQKNHLSPAWFSLP